MSLKKIKSFSRNSYAKINLYLDVLGLLPDGYHEIRTVFSAIDVADVLKFTLTRSKDIEILANVKAISNQDNLAVKVAYFLQEKYHVDRGVFIEMEKHIPLAAGMGGGSSNAATTIQALSMLWDLNLSDAEMWETAARFGSDIPYFLVGGTALGTHKGETITSLAPFIWENILLVKPSFGISAGEAYSFVKCYAETPVLADPGSTFHLDLLFNRLQEGVIGAYPVIGEIISDLADAGAVKAIMTGSGSTCVGFFDNRESMHAAKRDFEQKGYWTCCTKTRTQTNE